MRLVAVLFAISTPASADWSPTNPADVAKAKWIQLPDLSPNGLDVLDTIQPNTTPNPQWKTLADDFLCTQSGPITDAHIWGSWLSDFLPVNSAGLPDPGAVEFKISFWSDVPAGGPVVPYSHPGNLLWTGLFLPGQFKVNPNVLNAQEGFYDPNVGQVIGTDTHVYQYNFPHAGRRARAKLRANAGHDLLVRGASQRFEHQWRRAGLVRLEDPRLPPTLQ